MFPLQVLPEFLQVEAFAKLSSAIGKVFILFLFTSSEHFLIVFSAYTVRILYYQLSSLGDYLEFRCWPFIESTYEGTICKQYQGKCE